MKDLRKTKIICTIGPASESEETLRQLVDAGMNCARLNCSHGNPEEWGERIATLKKVRKQMGVPLAILLDTKGPEFRVGRFKNKSVTIKRGDKFTFTTKEVEGDETIVSVTYDKLNKDLEPGDIILAADGLVKLEVESIKGHKIHCKTLLGGTISNHKSLNFPGKNLSLKFLSDNDKRDLLFAIEQGVDYIAFSFVSTAEDIISAKEFLEENGGGDISIIAKIENQVGIDNLEEIAKHVDGIMVARGDLGVEIDYDKLPTVQKSIIRKCNKLGKLAVTATEMLESMVEHSRPTRAEISDVANAVYDGTSAIMLSAETAAGKYPVEAVTAMAKIAKSTEKQIPYEKILKNRETVQKGRTVDAIAYATCTIAVDVEAKGIVNLTASGFTSELISNFRPSVNVCAVTVAPKEFYKLALYWGINPVCVLEFRELSNLELLSITKKRAAETLGLDLGDKFVLNSG